MSTTTRPQKTVLVVEDDPWIRSLMADLLAGVHGLLATTVPFVAPTIAGCEAELYGTAGELVARTASVVNVMDG